MEFIEIKTTMVPYFWLEGEITKIKEFKYPLKVYLEDDVVNGIIPEGVLLPFDLKPSYSYFLEEMKELEEEDEDFMLMKTLYEIYFLIRYVCYKNNIDNNILIGF